MNDVVGENPASGRQTSPRFLDLFAGCGGLSLGLMKAGWQGILAVEKSELAFATLKHNLIDGRKRGLPFLDWPDWLPIEAISVQSFVKNYEQSIRENLHGKVDLIAGGPPCQGFSLAGTRSPKDSRNTLWKAYLNVVELVDPPMVLLENVHGITIEFGRERIRSKPRRPGRPLEPMSLRIQRGLENRGYKVFQSLVYAANYGVPQLRPRYFMIGVKSKGLADGVADPFETLRNIREEFVVMKGLPCERYISMREAISDLRKANGTYENPESPGFAYGVSTRRHTAFQHLLALRKGRYEPDSHRFANHRKKISKRFVRMMKECPRGVNVGDKKLQEYGTHKLSVTVSDPDQPSHTLTTLPDDILHYSEPRILTVREYARLQTFPDAFEFRGKYTTGGPFRRKETPRYSQAGNAVPPFLGEAIGSMLVDLLKRLEDHDDPVVSESTGVDTEATTQATVPATPPPTGCEEVVRAAPLPLAAEAGRKGFPPAVSH
ncbi:MAG: DNA cytosine methyltransferase [Nitrososphaerota archaeon]|jgi:DNA (cytosine-5)-methyltransferase 1|nr:DNA cytosine methyltransferase [Nitrososphaerota archaeon]